MLVWSGRCTSAHTLHYKNLWKRTEGSLKIHKPVLACTGVQLQLPLHTAGWLGSHAPTLEEKKCFPPRVYICPQLQEGSLHTFFKKMKLVGPPGPGHWHTNYLTSTDVRNGIGSTFSSLAPCFNLLLADILFLILLHLPETAWSLLH